MDVKMQIIMVKKKPSSVKNCDAKLRQLINWQ